jgi:SAM-dependent methyltransferase
MTAAQQTRHEMRKASDSMGRYLEEAGRKDIDVMDFGCGWGGETLWLARQVRSVVGVDVEAESVAQAERALREQRVTNCRFVHSPDGRIPVPDMSFDAVFSSDTLEHVMDLDLGFREIFRVLRPGGVFVSRFGPLFFSPQGYHLYWACQVPYAHLLFGLDAILELREVRSGERSRARSWQDMGLNRKRFRDYKRAATAAGFELKRFNAVPVRGLHLFTKLPLVGDLFVFGIDAHLRRPA